MSCSRRAVAALVFGLAVAAGLAVVMVATVAISRWWGGSGGAGGDAGPVSSHALTIDEVRSLSTLLTRRVELADVCVTRIDGVLGGVEAAMLVRGHVDLGVDLDAGDLQIVDPARRVAVLRLPAPHVVTASLDHDRTRIVALSYAGAWRLNPQPSSAQHVVERALAAAQEQFARAGEEPAHLDAARRHVETVVPAWASTLGWTLRVEWR